MALERGDQILVVARRLDSGALELAENELDAVDGGQHQRDELGVGDIRAVGFCGDDGEGYELRRALAGLGVDLGDFLTAPDRRTPVYCKPLILEAGTPPRELSRLDSKNWSETPEPLRRDLAARVLALEVDAVILMDQVDLAGTGVVTRSMAAAAEDLLRDDPGLVLIADSRRGLLDYPRWASR